MNKVHALETIGDESAPPYFKDALENSKGESHEFERALKGAID